MSKFVEWHNNITLESAKNALKENGFLVEVCSSKEECLKSAIKQIDKKATVGLGGSTTVREIGLYDYLIKNDYKIINPYTEELSPEEKMELRRQTLLADYFLASSNAITLEGELANIDGHGNRVAAITFGPQKVFLFVGMNKIVSDSEEALKRILDYTAPINAKRLNKDVPCAESGFCTDCDSPDRICKHLVITMRQNSPGRIKIFLIKENLGF
ncbi:MAG: lactate utilization protein [Candidatus Cloacimonadia bacterium]